MWTWQEFYAIHYFEAKTIEPHGMKNVLNSDRYNSQELINLLSPEARPFPSNLRQEAPQIWADLIKVYDKPDKHSKRKSLKKTTS